MKVKSDSEVAQLYWTLRDPMVCSLPGFSIHRIFQARILEWGAKDTTKTLLEQIKGISKVARYKINIHKSVAFQWMKNES